MKYLSGILFNSHFLNTFYCVFHQLKLIFNIYCPNKQSINFIHGNTFLTFMCVNSKASGKNVKLESCLPLGV